MFKDQDLERLTIKELEEKYPFVLSFFENNKLNGAGFEELTFPQYLNHFTEEDIGEWAIDTKKLKQDLVVFI
ncbi:MAG: ABC transporter ATP-binding protein, partial [Bacillota bacterium]